jgi:hypothetical protein
VTPREAAVRLKGIQFECNVTTTHLHDLINKASRWELLPPLRSMIEVRIWKVLDAYLPDMGTSNDDHVHMMNLYYALNTME